MSLQYKTRGMSDPQGKPRVYFCYHPEDFAACFGPISDELLKSKTARSGMTKQGDTWDEEREEVVW